MSRDGTRAAERSVDPAVERVVDGRTWEEFCDSLKAAGAVVLAADTPRDPVLRAEGWRYLTRLTRAALETFVEASDAQAPQFQQTTGPTIKMGMDNPDNVYLNAPVNGTYTYEITGRRGTVHYLSFGTQAGNYGSTGRLETTGSLDASNMKIEADGSFRVIASSEDPGDGSNWLRMQPDTRMIQIRQTRVDHRGETLAQVDIRRSDGPGRPRPLEPERLDRMLQGAAGFVRGCAGLFKSWADGFAAHVNELPRFSPKKATSRAGIRTSPTSTRPSGSSPTRCWSSRRRRPRATTGTSSWRTTGSSPSTTASTTST